MSEERLAPSKNRSEHRPGERNESALLRDLRELIVTEETESIQDLISLLGAIQSRIEDRQGLIELLKPVIASAIKERAKEDSEEIQEVLRPLVREVLEEQRQDTHLKRAPARPAVKKAGRRLGKLKDKISGLWGRMGKKTEVLEEEKSPAPTEPELQDASFALYEVYLLARPSLVLLGHGSWQPPHLQTQSQEQLLPLLRSFVRKKGEEGEIKDPIRARYDPFHVHIEPGRYAYLMVLYKGMPSVGFFLDVRQTLSDIHSRFSAPLRRAHSIASYRSALRLLLDRYRSRESRIGAQANDDPLKWPPAGQDISKQGGN